jgi:hypothetical protein
MSAVNVARRPFSYEMNSILPAKGKIMNSKEVAKVDTAKLPEKKSGHKFLITAAKVLFATVLIAGFIAATVFTFGAAAAAGAATASILYGVGTALGASSVGLMRLAGQTNMFRYTGNDAQDVRSFVSLGLNGVVNQIGQNVSKNFQSVSSDKIEEPTSKKKKKSTPTIEEVDDNTPVSKRKKKKPIVEEVDDRIDYRSQN